MKRYILFSAPTDLNSSEILNEMLPAGLFPKTAAYMPSDGSDIKEKYVLQWKNLINERGYDFTVINNSLRGEEAKAGAEKLLNSSVVLISGGNTFALSKHLKESGLDKVLKKFAEKQSFVLAGFSAGAIVLSPTIRIATTGEMDENLVGLTDLTSLGLVDFEVYPHYELRFEDEIAEYEKTHGVVVKRLSNDDLLVIDK